MRSTKSVVTNFSWRLAERIGAQGITFVVGIILARLLGPEAYGTIALVTVFTTILQVFADSGLGTALVQKKDSDDTDFSSVLFFNIPFCLVLYLIMFFAAPLIAAFYENDSLIPIIRVLCLNVLVSGIRNILQAYVSKNFLFKKFFFATLCGTVAAAFVGITMAYLGYGVWALVAQQLTNSVVGTVMLAIVIRWRPKLAFSIQRLGRLVRYGWKLLLSSLIDTVYTDLTQLVIGKVYTTSDLAYYNKGNDLPRMATTAINSSIDSVLLPTLSEAQDDTERLKAMARRAIRTGTYIIAPMMIGFVACAEPFVRVLLGEEWIDSVFFLRIFCIAYMFYPIHTSNLNAIKALGRSDWFLKLEIAKKLVGLTLLVSTMFISVRAMAYSVIISTVTSLLINTFPNRKLLRYSFLAQIKDILPNLGLAVAMGVPVYFIQYIPMPAIAVLVLQVITGVVLYIALSLIFKNETFFYILNIAKGFLKRSKKETT